LYSVVSISLFARGRASSGLAGTTRPTRGTVLESLYVSRVFIHVFNHVCRSQCSNSYYFSGVRVKFWFACHCFRKRGRLVERVYVELSYNFVLANDRMSDRLTSNVKYRGKTNCLPRRCAQTHVASTIHHLQLFAVQQQPNALTLLSTVTPILDAYCPNLDEYLPCRLGNRKDIYLDSKGCFAGGHH
jgi:hypothetical protein